MPHFLFPQHWKKIRLPGKNNPGVSPLLIPDIPAPLPTPLFTTKSPITNKIPHKPIYLLSIALVGLCGGDTQFRANNSSDQSQRVNRFVNDDSTFRALFPGPFIPVFNP